MDNVPISPNYMGYLNDSLVTYKRIGNLIDRYSAAQRNVDALSDALRKRQNAFCGKNLVVVCLVTYIPFLAIALILRLILPSAALFVFAGTMILPVGLMFVVKQLYENYVLPGVEDKIDKELSKNKKILDEAYADLLKDNLNLKVLSEGMDNNCKYPLSAFIMLEMAKRGQNNNIKAGCVAYLQNYEALGKATGEKAEESLALKNEIDDEREKYDDKYLLLSRILSQCAEAVD